MRQRIIQLQQRLADNFDQPDNSRLVLAAENYNLEALGVGGRRMTVLIDPNRVAKLAWRREGIVDNEIEWRLYNQADPELKQLLCPALELMDCGALVQERCIPIAYQDATITRQLASYGISDTAINLGLIGDKPVCFDYSMLGPEKMRQLLSGENSTVPRLDSLP